MTTTITNLDQPLNVDAIQGAFIGPAKQKLGSLIDQGYSINGFAITREVEGSEPQRGFIDVNGLVGWWTPALQALERAHVAMEALRVRCEKVEAEIEAAKAVERERDALRVQVAALTKPLEPVHGDVLPPIGSRVFIRHGRDDDAHECTVTGYYAWGDLAGNKHLHRVFVRLVYEGTTTENARMLCDCYPTAEAALSVAPQTDFSPLTTPEMDLVVNRAHAYVRQAQIADASTKALEALERWKATPLDGAAMIKAFTEVNDALTELEMLKNQAGQLTYRVVAADLDASKINAEVHTLRAQVEALKKVANSLPWYNFGTRPAVPAFGDPSTAPKDGRTLLLLVEFDDNNLEDHPEPQLTIGHNSLENTGVDEWKFSGWNWTHDCYTQGVGKVLGWLPFRATTAAAPQPDFPPLTTPEMDLVVNRAHAYVRQAGPAVPEEFLESPDIPDEDSGLNTYYSRELVLECIAAALAAAPQTEAQPTEAAQPQLTDAVIREKARLYVQAGRSWRGCWSQETELFAQVVEMGYIKGMKAAQKGGV